MGPEHKYNMVLLGPVGVGKSAFTVKYITKRFIMDYDPFIEGTYSKVDVVDNHEVLVRVRDTYLENFADVGKYLKWADGYLVVYSVTSRDSFEQARGLLEVLRRQLRARPVDCPVVLVGNKSDLERCRQVSATAGSALASQFGCRAFCETSASEELASVEAAMHTLVREVQRERDGGSGGVGCIPSFTTDVSSNVELAALFISDEMKSMSLPVGSVAPKGGSSGTGHVRRTKTAKLSGAAALTGALAMGAAATSGDEQKRRANGGEGRRWPGGSAGSSSSASNNTSGGSPGGSSSGGGFRLFNKSFKIFS